MQFIILWLVSIITSLTFDFILVIDIMKSLAEDGYYLDRDKMPESEDSSAKIFLLIPFLNIMQSFLLVSLRNDFLYYLDMNGCIVQMNEEQKERYKNNKSLSTILDIINDAREDSNLEYNNTLEIKEKEQDNEEKINISDKKLLKNEREKLLNEIIAAKVVDDDALDKEFEKLSYDEKTYVLKKAIFYLKQELKQKKREQKAKTKVKK